MKRWKGVVVGIWLVLPARAGQVLVVGPAPAPYTRIQDAINAAQSGDIVLVKAPAHDSIRIAGKGLSVVADTGVTIQEAGAVRVSNVRSKDFVLLCGIAATGVASAAVPELGNGLVADACAGAVLVQDCALAGDLETVPTCLPAHAGAFVRNTAAVSFTRCALRGGAVAMMDRSLAPTQGPGLDVPGASNVSCDDVDARGGSQGATCNWIYAGDGAMGGSGARFLGGSLFASGSGFLGGLGGDAAGGGSCVPGSLGGAGGHGVENVLPTNPVLVRRLDTLVSGNLGGLSCGFAGQGPPGSATFGGTQVSIGGTARRVAGSTLVRDDALATLTFRGAPNERVEIAVARDAAGFQYDAAQRGILHVRAPRWRSAGIVPAAGVLTVSYKLPDLPLSDPGAVFVAQARFVDPATGQSRLSNAHAIVEVDASY